MATKGNKKSAECSKHSCNRETPSSQNKQIPNIGMELCTNVLKTKTYQLEQMERWKNGRKEEEMSMEIIQSRLRNANLAQGDVD